MIRRELAPRLADLLSTYKSAGEDNAHLANRPDLASSALLDACRARASDVHLELHPKEMRVRFRIDGALSDAASLTLDAGKCLANQLKALANLDPVTRFTPQDSHARVFVEGQPVDLRLALVPTGQGEALSIRLLDPLRLERAINDLGLTDSNIRQMHVWLENINGMFLAAGPTGCGKTTTVYALLHELKVADRRVVSIEDPIEYLIPGITQVQLDEKHHVSFAEGVKAVLRLDPDFLMIGEIRDSASAHAAVDAAITGRVLMSTLHSRDAVGAITALRNWGLPDHEIAESLTVVVAQRLVRRLCPHCKVEAAPTKTERAWLRALNLKAPKVVWAPAACRNCNGLGYHGRIGIFELWHLAESDYQLILDHADEHTLRRKFARAGRMPISGDALAKVAAGITSLGELRRAGAGAFPGEGLNIATGRARADLSPVLKDHANERSIV